MERFENTLQLLKALSKLEQEQWIFANIQTWGTSPEKCHFYYLPWSYMESLADDAVYENSDGAELPVKLKDENLKEWMLVGSLTKIAKDLNMDSLDVNNFIYRVNYYREFDTFSD